ncbi:MAG: tyrosine-type recombinase/integrase [Desulfobacula sp.]|jgi:integrase
MTDDEINVLLPELKKVSEETFCHAVMALNTGMRAGEIWGLTSWADVDLENSILTLRDTKNRKTRIAYLNDITSRLLTDRKPQNPDPYGLIFPGKGGAKIDKISRTFKRVADRIGLNAGITDPRQKNCFSQLQTCLCQQAGQESHRYLCGERTPGAF